MRRGGEQQRLYRRRSGIDGRRGALEDRGELLERAPAWSPSGELEGRGGEADLRCARARGRHVREGGAHGGILTDLELCAQDASAQVEPHRVLARQQRSASLAAWRAAIASSTRDCPRSRRARPGVRAARSREPRPPASARCARSSHSLRLREAAQPHQRQCPPRRAQPRHRDRCPSRALRRSRPPARRAGGRRTPAGRCGRRSARWARHAISRYGRPIRRASASACSRWRRPSSTRRDDTSRDAEIGQRGGAMEAGRRSLGGCVVRPPRVARGVRHAARSPRSRANQSVVPASPSSNGCRRSSGSADARRSATATCAALSS